MLMIGGHSICYANTVEKIIPKRLYGRADTSRIATCIQAEINDNLPNENIDALGALGETDKHKRDEAYTHRKIRRAATLVEAAQAANDTLT